MNYKSTNPGPGYYNVSSGRIKPIWTAPTVVCFFKGADCCSMCEEFLFGDYYKSLSGRMCWCLKCFRKLKDPIRGLPCSVRKVRHCSAYHEHIEVENIVRHKTTLKQIRHLNIMEKRMWNKFGEMLDHKGLPI